MKGLPGKSEMPAILPGSRDPGLGGWRDRSPPPPPPALSNPPPARPVSRAGSRAVSTSAAKFMKETKGISRVSVERVVSGTGLVNVYEFLRKKFPERVDKDVDSGEFGRRRWIAFVVGSVSEVAVPSRLSHACLPPGRTPASQRLLSRLLRAKNPSPEQVGNLI